MIDGLEPVRFCLDRYTADLTPRQTEGLAPVQICSLVTESIEPELLVPYTRLDPAMEALSSRVSRLTTIPGRRTWLTHAEIYAVDVYGLQRIETHLAQVHDDRDRRDRQNNG